MSNTFLLKLSVLGTVLLFYGGMNHLRKHPELQAALLKRLPEKYHARFKDFVAPKSAVSVETAKTDMKKIRSVDEGCFQDGGQCNRYSDKPTLEAKFGETAKGDNTLGKAAKQLIKLEKANFDKFDKIDRVTE